MPILAEILPAHAWMLVGALLPGLMLVAFWMVMMFLCWAIGLRMTRRSRTGTALVLAFLAVAGAAHADVLPSPSAQGWWDGWKFLIALISLAILVMQFLSYFRRSPPIDVDLQKLRSEFLSNQSFEMHRIARDQEVDALRRETADLVAKYTVRAEEKIESLRQETKEDLHEVQKKISIGLAGVHDRCNVILEKVSEVRGMQGKGGAHG